MQLSLDQETFDWICTYLLQARPGTPQCLLSGDTQESAGRNAFQQESGAIYAEKVCDGPRRRQDIPQDRPRVRPQNDDGNDARPIGDQGISFGTNGIDDGLGIGLTGTGSGSEDEDRNRDRDRKRDRDRDRDRVEGRPGECRSSGLETTYEKVHFI